LTLNELSLIFFLINISFAIIQQYNSINHHLQKYSLISYSSTILYPVLLLIFLSLPFFGCTIIKPEAELTISAPDSPLPEVQREFRAVWIATVANIDWPSQPGLSSQEQKREMIQILDRAAALNMNAVIFQVRPAADAIYNSPYEPWASYLSGQMGKPPIPAYDPLEFTIKEAHKRGLELHAWFNPFRAGHPVDSSEISSAHISQTNPELVHQYGDFLWLDPGLPEAREHSRKVIMDVVERYNIDGVHFDDYFYPYRSYANGADFPDDQSWIQALNSGTDMSRADWRRRNVDLFIEQIYREIKEKKPFIKFGISPFGIWQPGHPHGTTGFNSHEELYADARRWLQSGWVDYLSPQIYYRTDQVGQPFPVILQWWSEQNHYGRHIWPGLYTSRLITPDIKWSGDEIQRQLYILRGFPGINGAIHFSMQAIMRNPDRFRDLLAAGPYADQALVPVTPWIHNQDPLPPDIFIENSRDQILLNIVPNGNDIRQFIVRTRYDNHWEIDILPSSQRVYPLQNNNTYPAPDEIYISAVNRLGNESSAVKANGADLPVRKETIRPESLPNFISRDDWSPNYPGGHPASGIRRNMVQGDTLIFRDLTLILSKTEPSTSMTIPSETPRSEGIVLSTRSDSVHLTLYRNDVSEQFILSAGTSFNWYGYHISILDISFQTPVSDSGTVEIEAATVQSLPVDRAANLEPGTASQRIRIPHRINRITLHHTGSAEPLLPEDYALEKIQAMLSWSRETRNWWDLPYHFLIDLKGNIYEGRNLRYAGDVNGEYDPRGHLKIAVIGNYNQQKPTDQQVISIRALIDWASKTFDIPSDRIHGQDEWANTAGPGIYIRSLIDGGVFNLQASD
jgi:uncharacterized lipoprotein YddW (UPF0748 family)